MQAHFEALRNFDFANASVHLWVYKTSTAVKKYTAHYVQTDRILTDRFQEILRLEMLRLSEISAYAHLAETNEISCLAIEEGETDFNFLKAQVDRVEPDFPARNISDLKGASGYVVKFSTGGTTVYAVRRTIANWKTSFPKKYINVIFRNGELSAAEDNAFTIERNFDFFVKDGYIFVANKKAFETVLQYRVAYQSSFSVLQLDPTFGPLFENVQPLVDFVGQNPMHLRRMSAVVQKNLFSDPIFLPNLQRVNALRNWGLNFDPVSNKILVCDQTAKTVIDVLLDHRLMSEVTANSYLVPDATLQP